MSGAKPERTPATGKEKRTIEYLIALSSELTRAGDTLRARLKAVPGGWRDFRMMEVKATKLLDGIYKTMDARSLTYLENLIHHGEVLIRLRPTVRSGEWVLVQDEDLEAIIQAAMGAECGMCLKEAKEVKRCALRQALDRIAPPKDGHPAIGCGYQDVELGGGIRRNGGE